MIRRQHDNFVLKQNVWRKLFGVFFIKRGATFTDTLRINIIVSVFTNNPHAQKPKSGTQVFVPYGNRIRDPYLDPAVVSQRFLFQIDRLF